MFKIVLGFTGHSRDAECVCLYNGSSGAAANASIDEAGKGIVRVEIYSNPVPTKRRVLIPREQDEPKADLENAERLANEAAKENSNTPPEQAAGEAGESVKAPAATPDASGDETTSDSKESTSTESADATTDSGSGKDPEVDGADSKESEPPASGDQPELPAANEKTPAAKQAAKKAATKQGKQK